MQGRGLINSVQISDLAVYIRAEHTRERPHQCPSCPYSKAQHMSALIRHVRVKHTDIGSERPHKWPIYSYGIAFKICFRENKAREINTFRCPDCSYSTSFKNSLSNHTKAKHTGERSHRCLSCTYISVCKQHHIVHKNDTYYYVLCTGESSHRCPSVM